MKFNFNSMTRSFNKMGLVFKKHSPEILVVSGVVGTVTASVLACRATAKCSDILEEHKKKMDQVREALEVAPDDYTEEDVKKDTVIIYTQTAMAFAKLYGPSVILGAVSIAGILTGHNILRKRNIALAAAYATVDKSFKEYRGRVVERFGEGLDKELRYDIKAKEFEKRVTDEKTGDDKIEKEVVEVGNVEFSEYAKIFDDGCKGWTKDPEANKSFLMAQERYANDKLKANGYLFLNDVYDALGFQRTKAGQVVGWIYDDENPIGDNHVDFGMFNIAYEGARNFVNGYERNIVLDFNVDGNILDMI